MEAPPGQYRTNGAVLSPIRTLPSKRRSKSLTASPSSVAEERTLLQRRDTAGGYHKSDNETISTDDLLYDEEEYHPFGPSTANNSKAARSSQSDQAPSRSSRRFRSSKGAHEASTKSVFSHSEPKKCTGNSRERSSMTLDYYIERTRLQRTANNDSDEALYGSGLTRSSSQDSLGSGTAGGVAERASSVRNSKRAACTGTNTPTRPQMPWKGPSSFFNSRRHSFSSDDIPATKALEEHEPKFDDFGRVVEQNP